VSGTVSDLSQAAKCYVHHSRNVFKRASMVLKVLRCKVLKLNNDGRSHVFSALVLVYLRLVFSVEDEHRQPTTCRSPGCAIRVWSVVRHQLRANPVGPVGEFQGSAAECLQVPLRRDRNESHGVQQARKDDGGSRNTVRDHETGGG
jgi:hypothetical protein